MKSGLLTAMRYLAIFGTGACLLLPMSSHASSETGAPRPTPAHWDQWQPETDRSDARLERRLSLWRHEVEIGALLSLASSESSVGFTVTDDLSRLRVSIFAENRALSGVMVALARFVDGFWVYRRDEAPGARTYCLLAHAPQDAPTLPWVRERLERERLIVSSIWRPAREELLERYRSALALSPQALLDRYEQSDPWLCATLLDPETRPLVAQIVSLPVAGREELMSQGRLWKRLGSFDSAFQEHVVARARAQMREDAEQRAAAAAAPQQGPRFPPRHYEMIPRFESEEDSWKTAVVGLRWDSGIDGLGFSLRADDTFWYGAYPIVGPSQSPADARRKLISLGVRDATPEYLTAIEQEEAEWHPPDTSQRKAQVREELQGAGLLPPAPNSGDPRLQRPLDLYTIESKLSPIGGTLTFTEAVEQVALQHMLAVVASYVPPTDFERLLGRGSHIKREMSLGDLLETACHGDRWTWRLYGEYVVVRDLEQQVREARRAAEELVAAWRRSLGARKSVTFDEVAYLIAQVGPLQSTAVMDQLAEHPGGFYSPHRMYVYGMLSAEERRAARTAGLPCSQLTGEQQQELFQWVGGMRRPWLDVSDLGEARIRAVRRDFSTGQPGLAVRVELPHPDSPRDREILYWAPLEFGLKPLNAAD